MAGQPGAAVQLAPAQNPAAPGQVPAGQPSPLPAEAAPGQGIPAQGVPPQGNPGQPVAPQGIQGQPVAPQGIPGQGIPGQAVPGVPSVPGQPIPPQGVSGQAVPAQGLPAQGQPVSPHGIPGQVAPVQGQSGEPVPPQALPAAQPTPGAGMPGTAPAAVVANGAGTSVAPNAEAHPNTPAPGAPHASQGRAAQPLPAEAVAPIDPNSTQGRAISVRTLGQGVPFTRQAAQVQQPTATPPPHQPGGGGRRRKLGTRPEPAGGAGEQGGRAHPQGEQAQPSMAGQSRLAQMTEGAGRSYAIGAPDENAAEGPEPLDGPGGAVEIADTPRPQPLDDELPPSRSTIRAGCSCGPRRT